LRQQIQKGQLVRVDPGKAWAGRPKARFSVFFFNAGQKALLYPDCFLKTTFLLKNSWFF